MDTGLLQEKIARMEVGRPVRPAEDEGILAFWLAIYRPKSGPSSCRSFLGCCTVHHGLAAAGTQCENDVQGLKVHM